MLTDAYHRCTEMNLIDYKSWTKKLDSIFAKENGGLIKCIHHNCLDGHITKSTVRGQVCLEGLNMVILTTSRSKKSDPKWFSINPQ
jgi:hypothetical protein